MKKSDFLKLGTEAGWLIATEGSAFKIGLSEGVPGEAVFVQDELLEVSYEVLGPIDKADTIAAKRGGYFFKTRDDGKLVMAKEIDITTLRKASIQRNLGSFFEDAVLLKKKSISRGGPEPVIGLPFSAFDRSASRATTR